MAETLLETVDLVKSFPVRRGFLGRKQYLMAIEGINLKIDKGETLGMVGESGCGKSTLGLTIMRLYEPTRGKILIQGDDITTLDGAGLRKARRQMQMIFQDPFASLDPRLTVQNILREPLDIHGIGAPADRTEEVKRLLDITGMPADSASRYPNEFSGGQQQRIGIARALALQPKLLICDEPVSSLDVSVQAQILNLLRDLQEEYELTYLFISHNISITAFMSRRIGVMYLGHLVEIAPSKEIINEPRHPYTQALLKAVPEPNPKRKRGIRALMGEIPSPIDRPSGCQFHPRCPLAKEICKVEIPKFRELSPEHFAACHFA